MVKKDSILLGFFLGLVAPFLGPVVYYFVVFYHINVTFSDFLLVMGQNKSLLTGVSSLSLMANAVFFAICIHFRKDKTAKGIFLSTLIYGIAVLLIKVIR